MCLSFLLGVCLMLSGCLIIFSCLLCVDFFVDIEREIGDDYVIYYLYECCVGVGGWYGLVYVGVL